MISYEKALQLLDKYVPDQKRKEHCLGVSRIAFGLAIQIDHQHPELKIDTEKVRIAGLLHDIGYGGNEKHHEIASLKILKKEKLSDIADIVEHGYLYEIYLLEGTDNPDFLPHSLEQEIVVYADLLYHQEYISLKKRLVEIQNRKKEQSKRMIALTLASSRFLKLEKKLLHLSQH